MRDCGLQGESGNDCRLMGNKYCYIETIVPSLISGDLQQNKEDELLDFLNKNAGHLRIISRADGCPLQVQLRSQKSTERTKLDMDMSRRYR